MRTDFSMRCSTTWSCSSNAGASTTPPLAPDELGRFGAGLGAGSASASADGRGLPWCCAARKPLRRRVAESPCACGGMPSIVRSL